MSGGPPHHTHGRRAPSPNTAWNHLQVPNYYPRQPQHAHTSNEHSLLHQSTWHTPTTESVNKSISHSHIFNLEQIISEKPFSRHSPGVDLSLQKNGSQNGELPTTPISLSVRDTNKINSLPVSAIDIQVVELTKSLSPVLKSTSGKSIGSVGPIASNSLDIKSPTSPNSAAAAIHEIQDGSKTLKRPSKRMDFIIERLNPVLDKIDKIDKLLISNINDKVIIEQNKYDMQTHNNKCVQESVIEKEKSVQSSIIVPPTSVTGSYDDNSNSSGILNISTPTTVIDEDVISSFSNEDSTDSNKSRRKRKPSKTMRVAKEIDRRENSSLSTHIVANEPEIPKSKLEIKCTQNKQVERRRSGSAPPYTPLPPTKSRRKTSSESETIANIAAMIEKTDPSLNSLPMDNDNMVEVRISQTCLKPVLVSVIKCKTNVNCNNTDQINYNSKVNVSPNTMISFSTDKNVSETNSFVEVENKLEEMFAGISDELGQSQTAIYEESNSLELQQRKNQEVSLNMENSSAVMQYNDSVSSTSNDQNFQKRGRPKGAKSQRSSDLGVLEISSKKKKGNKRSKFISEGSTAKVKAKKIKRINPSAGKQISAKVDVIKDMYTYDSGSNASSSKSRGPFVQIRGNRDSPISVNIVNTPTNDDESDKKINKLKKYHDDTEYRHKVRSRGLHCSTLSNKYDAQTRDATWICVFCKRGPHATEPHLSGPSCFNGAVLISPPGDLFGPYIISTSSVEYQRRLDDPYDQQFKSKKVARMLNNTKVITKKFKRKHSESYDGHFIEGTDNVDIFLGINETQDKIYEVWAHEDCIVWSPGVYLVGPKIVGLEEAVWTSCNVVCNKCHYRGANLCCVKRGCTSVVHFGCAATSDWQLDNENYKPYCAAHRCQ